jgi:transposase InsO family protein
MHRVDWYNERRLPRSIGYMPPAEAGRRHLERAEPASDVA